MSFTEQALPITTVGDDHTIILPNSVPNGATIGILALSDVPKRKLTRTERFKLALAEIERAMERNQSEPITLPPPSEFNALVERVCKEAKPA